MLTWQERAPRQQRVDLRANEAGSGRCKIAAMSGDVRQGSWHQLGLFDVFKVTIIFFGGFGSQTAKMCMWSDAGSCHEYKVRPALEGRRVLFVLFDMWKAYFLLPPVAVEVAKNMRSLTDLSRLF